LQELLAKAKSEDPKEQVDADNDMIESGLVEPKMTRAQILDLKPQFSSAFATAILSASLGVEQKDIKDKMKEAVQDKEEELKKNN
jgi:hypothetical protein